MREVSLLAALNAFRHFLCGFRQKNCAGSGEGRRANSEERRIAHAILIEA
jgi:hypothetical protein